MFSVPRFIGGLAAAGLSAVVAMPSAVHAANTVGYSDPLCSAFYVDGSPGAQTLKCAKLACSISTNIGYIQPTGTSITLTATCTNPVTPTANLQYQWRPSAQSPATCPSPVVQAATPNQATVTNAATQVCWYEVIATDGVANTGWSRYGLKWQ